MYSVILTQEQLIALAQLMSKHALSKGEQVGIETCEDADGDMPEGNGASTVRFFFASQYENEEVFKCYEVSTDGNILYDYVMSQR